MMTAKRLGWCVNHHGHFPFQDSADGLVPADFCIVWEVWRLRGINMNAVQPCVKSSVWLIPDDFVGEAWLESTGDHSLSGWWTDHPLSEGPFYLIPKNQVGESER